MLGQAGNGKLRVSMGQSKLAAKVAKKYVSSLHFCSKLIFIFTVYDCYSKFLLCLHGDFRFKEKSYGSSGFTSGLSSSLAFTPVQVIIFSSY